MSDSFLEKDFIMCCPAASVYILCIILLTACKTIHFTNGCRVWGFTQISAIMLTPSQEISNGFAAKPRTWENCLRVRETSCRIFWIQKICNFFLENLPGILGKSASFFWEVCHQLRKSIAYFGKIRHRLWGNPPPTLFKSATDFGKMSHRLWENQPPTLRKAVTDFGEMPSPIWASLCI